MRFAPVQGWAELLLEGAHDLAGLGVAAEPRFAEHQLTVETYLESALLTRLQPDAAKDRRPRCEHLVGQAHGPVEIVSRDAEFNLRFVLWRNHTRVN